MIKIDNTQKLLLASVTLMLVLAIAPTTSAYAQSAVDIIFVVDESGSMSQEQAFIGGTLVPALEAALTAANIGTGGTPNLYSAAGFACSGSSPQVVQTPVIAGSFPAGNPFCTVGGTQDGYLGISFALAQGWIRGGNVAAQVILVTDEDRDIVNGGLNIGNIAAALNAQNAGLNVVVCVAYIDANTNPALGLFSPQPAGAPNTAYTADGAGGFTTSAPGTINPAIQNCNAAQSGAIIPDYVTLAANLGGGAWNLNFIAPGGNGATSFANAFADAKVSEVIEQFPIGGEILPISSASLMLAGIQSSAIWMLPVLVGAAGTAALYLRTRKN